MAKMVTVRFYQVGKMHAAAISLRAALEGIFAVNQPGARERQLSGSFRCRLERLHVDGGFVTGEMTRVRETDYPSEVHPEGVTGLGVDVPIGDGVAFCYREADHRLAIEYDPRTLSPGRMMDYISSMNAAAIFTLESSVDANALARFRAQPVRKVRITLAGANNLAGLENPIEPVGTSLRNLGEEYTSPIVTVEMSMGNQKGHLSNGLKQVVEGFLLMAGQGEDVRSLHVTPDAGEGQTNEDINLLDQILSVKDQLTLPNKQPDAAYALRATNVRAKLDAHV
jgi:hypothetical protein